MNLGNENETQEFKEGLGQLDKGIKSLTAMLNRHGFGSVYFGVDDNGNVKGLTVGKKTLMDIRSRVNDLVEPKIIVNIEILADENNKTFLKVSTQGSDIPYSCDGRYYVRHIAADEKATNELLRKMLASGDADIIKQVSSEVQELTFSSLFSILSASIHISNSKTFYKSYGLLNNDGKFNFMAYLLSDQNNLSIKVTRYAGIDKTVMLERTEYGHQCLLESVQQVLTHFKSTNTTKVNLKEGKRKEVSLFAYEAFREAWINACLHNNWNDKVPPAVYIFDDRIEIVSYGGLPYGLSVEGFYKGTSLPINKSLLTMFIVAGFAEQSGHGVPIIVNTYGKKAFSFSDGLVKVTLKLAFESDSVISRKSYESRKNTLRKNQVLVLDYLITNPESTLQNAADNLSLSLGGVKKIVAALQELGLLRRLGGKRKGVWVQ